MIRAKSPQATIEKRYDRFATEYLHSLPMEHFMESIAQSTQREYTLESLAIFKLSRPDVHVFSELLVQYPLPRKKRPGQVVPDNMIVVYDGKLTASLSYMMPLQPVGPFWVLEYLSKNNKRKDYVDNMQRYERDLKVPYYLLFDPDKQILTLYKHSGKKYAVVKANANGRLAVPELDLEVAIHDRWVRFWHHGKLLPLPGDLKLANDSLELANESLESANESLRDEVARLRRQLAEKHVSTNGKKK